MICSFSTGCRLDVHETKHPESYIHNRSGECMFGIVFGRYGGNLDQNLVHSAILVDIGPELVVLTYQQEVQCDVELDHGWSA